MIMTHPLIFVNQQLTTSPRLSRTFICRIRIDQLIFDRPRTRRRDLYPVRIPVPPIEARGLLTRFNTLSRNNLWPECMCTHILSHHGSDSEIQKRNGWSTVAIF